MSTVPQTRPALARTYSNQASQLSNFSSLQSNRKTTSNMQQQTSITNVEKPVTYNNRLQNKTRTSSNSGIFTTTTTGIGSQANNKVIQEVGSKQKYKQMSEDLYKIKNQLQKIVINQAKNNSSNNASNANTVINTINTNAATSADNNNNVNNTNGSVVINNADNNIKYIRLDNNAMNYNPRTTNKVSDRSYDASSSSHTRQVYRRVQVYTQGKGQNLNSSFSNSQPNNPGIITTSNVNGSSNPSNITGTNENKNLNLVSSPSMKTFSTHKYVNPYTTNTNTQNAANTSTTTGTPGLVRNNSNTYSTPYIRLTKNGTSQQSKNNEPRTTVLNTSSNSNINNNNGNNNITNASNNSTTVVNTNYNTAISSNINSSNNHMSNNSTTNISSSNNSNVNNNNSGNIQIISSSNVNGGVQVITQSTSVNAVQKQKAQAVSVTPVRDSLKNNLIISIPKPNQGSNKISKKISNDVEQVHSPVPIQYNPNKLRPAENIVVDSLNIHKRTKTQPDSAYEEPINIYNNNYNAVQKDGYYISGYNNSNIYPTYASNSPSGDNLNGVNKMGNSSNNASNNGVAYGNNSNNATYSNSKGMNSNIYKNLFDSVSLNQFFSPQIDDAYEPAPRKQEPLKQQIFRSQADSISCSSDYADNACDNNKHITATPDQEPVLNKIQSVKQSNLNHIYANNSANSNRYSYSPSKSQTYASLSNKLASTQDRYNQTPKVHRYQQNQPQTRNNYNNYLIRTLNNDQIEQSKSIKDNNTNAHTYSNNTNLIRIQSTPKISSPQTQRNRLSENLIARRTAQMGSGLQDRNINTRRSQSIQARGPRIIELSKTPDKYLQKNASVVFSVEQQRNQLRETLQQLRQQKQKLKQQKERLEYELEIQVTKNKCVQAKYEKVCEQYEQCRNRQDSLRERVMGLQRQIYNVRSRKHNGFDDVLKTQMQQTCKIKQVIQEKNEEITRLNQIISINHRNTEQAINQANVQKLRYVSQKNELQQLHEINLLNKDNQIKRLRHALETMQSKLQVAIKQNRTKDQFLQQHIVGRASNDSQRQYINALLSKYQFQFPVNKLAEKLLQEQKQIERLNKIIKGNSQ